MSLFDLTNQSESELLLTQNNTITSLELLKQINIFREMEENRAVLLHKTLLEIIRDEFEEEISQQKILPSEYTSDRGQTYPMFELTISEAKQVLVRESKYVRKAVIQRLEQLENNQVKIPKTYGEALLEAGRIQIKLDESLLKLQEQKPKVELADNYLSNGGNMNLSATAKALGIGVVRLGEYLGTNNIIYQTFRGDKLPYSQFESWFFCKPFVAKNGHTGIQLLVTPKGFENLTRRFKKAKPKTIKQLLLNHQ